MSGAGILAMPSGDEWMSGMPEPDVNAVPRKSTMPRPSM
jgi:hypothetical protein